MEAEGGDGPFSLRSSDIEVAVQCEDGCAGVRRDGPVAEVAADGAHVADLRPGDAGGGFPEHGDAFADDGGFLEIGKAGPRAHAHGAVRLAGDGFQFGQVMDIHEPGEAFEFPQLDEHVRAACDEAGFGIFSEQPDSVAHGLRFLIGLYIEHG